MRSPPRNACAIERYTDEARLVGRFQMHLDLIARARASVRIGERATDLREKAEEAGKPQSILDEAYRSEIAFRAGAGRNAAEPEFLRKEIERAADNIETIRDSDLLRRLDAYVDWP